MTAWLNNSLLIFLGWNVVVCCLYAYDKMQARRHRWRVSERLLLSVSVLAGGIGGFGGMCLMRHKIRKPLFYIANAIGCVVFVYICYVM